jgi:hypothetical protein
MRQGVYCHGEDKLRRIRRETEYPAALWGEGECLIRALNHGGKIGSPYDLGLGSLKSADWRMEERSGIELNSFV